MRKKLTSVVLALTAVCAIVVFTALVTATKAQEGGSQEDPPFADGECPSDMCFSSETVDSKSGEPAAPLGTCTCGIFYDPDCHYEYISAFDCIPYWHEDGIPNDEWESVHNHDSMWGLRKTNSGSYQLDLMCPIPTDNGAGSNKYYGDVALVKGYFYHYNSSYSSTMYVYSAKASDVEYHGNISDSSSGQRTLTVTPVGSNYYIFWYARIYVANYDLSSFHGLEICYDPY